MYTTYRKTLYGDYPGFHLHHTVGLDAGTSTLDHPHLCPEYMLFYFMHGEGKIKIEGKHYDIHSGDMFFTSPEELFHCSIDPSCYHERIVLHIHESFFQSFPCDVKPLFAFFGHSEGGNRIPSDIVKDRRVDALFLQILKFVQTPTPVNRVLVLCKIAELLATLEHLLISDRPNASQTSSENSIIERVLAYLNQNYCESITVRTIADVFGINHSYLSHIFKEHTGISLWNYVILRRLHHFNNLIRQGETIETACYQVGFQNHSNFYRLYKKYIGMTPVQFKRQLLSEKK